MEWKWGCVDRVKGKEGQVATLPLGKDVRTGLGCPALRSMTPLEQVGSRVCGEQL